MMNLIKIQTFVLILALFISGCRKENEDNNILPKPDGAAFKNAIADKREADTQTFTVDMTNGGEVVGKQGTIVRFNPGDLSDMQGNTVTGDIEVKLLEIYSKADMLLMNKPTMGRMTDGKKAMLISGGEIFLNASQNGKDLVINGTIRVDFPAANTGGPDQDMLLFTGNTECGTTDAIVCPEEAWEEVKPGRGELFNEPIQGTDYYIAFIPDFGWTNVDKFFSDPRPKTTLLVDAPDGYDNTNCAIYLSYDGEDSGLAALDTYLQDSQLFSEHYGQIPIGLEVHIIAMSVLEDGQYAYTIKGVTIADGETIVLDDLTPISEADLIAAIENLP